MWSFDFPLLFYLLNFIPFEEEKMSIIDFLKVVLCVIIACIPGTYMAFSVLIYSEEEK